MPQIFKIGSYTVYFWANEGKPLEAVHVHISQGVPSEHATKVWITKAGKCLLYDNGSRIPLNTLKNMMDIIEANSQFVTQKWRKFFGEIRYFC
ncbi:MAG: DUF4160 domain-containing protein [Oscillospiraceae bacterium]|nr:DUF4160 domain-containing protein [Oscillospiraceae bacterium]